MANNIEVILSGKDAGFTDTLNKAAATLSAKNTEMLNSLGLTAKGLGDTGKAAADAGANVSASATKYTALSEAARNMAAGQTLIRAQIKDTNAAIKEGSVDAIAGKAAILELNAASRALGSSYSAAARAISASAGDVVGSHSRMSVSSQLMMHSVRSAADSFAAGLPPMMIFTEQLGRVGEAAALSGGGAGALGKFGAFMGTGWGIAITAAVAVLGTFIAKMDLFGNAAQEAADKLKKQKEEGELTRLAEIEYDKTIDGTIEKLRKVNAELERRIKNQAQLNGQQTLDVASTLATARSNQSTAQGTYNSTKTARDSALDALKHPAVGATPEVILGLASAFRTAEANFTKAQSDLIKANSAVLDGERALRAARAVELQDQAKGIADPRLGARQVLEAKQGALTDKYMAGQMAEGEYRAGYARIQGQIDALTHQASASAENSLGQMITLIKQLFPGAIITSTTGGKHVAGSDHYSGHAIDFVPAGGMDSISKDAAEKRLKDAGVNIRRNAQGVEQFFDNDNGKHDHFHVAWSGTPNSDDAARKAKEQQDKDTRRAKQFADMSAGLDQQLLDAKKTSLTDADALAQVALHEIQVANDKFTADVMAKEKLGDLTKAQGDELLVKQAIVSALKAQQITEEAKFKKEQEDLTIWSAANDNQVQILQLQEQFAVTLDERRKIQLQILADEKEQQRRQAQIILDNPKASAADRTNAQGALNSLDTVYGLKQANVVRSTESPIDAYVRANDPKLIGEKVQTLVVSELETVRGSIDDAIDNELHIKDPLLKGLVDQFINNVLIQPIAQALQRNGAGGFFGAIGKLFGGGSSIAASAASTIAANPAIFASGGYVSGPGSTTSDSIPAMLSNGEFVLNARAVNALGIGKLTQFNNAPRFASGGFAGTLPDLDSPRDRTVQIVPSPYFDVVVDGRIQNAAPVIAGLGAVEAQTRMTRNASRRVA